MAAARSPEVADALAAPFVRAWEDTGRMAPSVAAHPRVTFAVLAAAALAGVSYYWRCARARASFIAQHGHWDCAPSAIRLLSVLQSLFQFKS